MKAGDRVEHTEFGNGTILTIQEEETILVEFDSKPLLGHSGDGRGKDAHCRFCRRKNIITIYADSAWKNSLQNIIEQVTSLLQSNKWSWSKNVNCKYVNVMVDMRDGKCLLKNRHGDIITLDDLKKQSGGHRAEETKTEGCPR